MHASLGAHLGESVVEQQFALIGWIMRVGAGRAEVVVGDELHDVGRTEFGDSAVGVEGIVVRLESFKSTQGAGTFGRLGALGR